MFYIVTGDNGKILRGGYWNQPGEPPFEHIKVPADVVHAFGVSRGLMRYKDGKFYYPQDDIKAAKMLLSYGSWEGPDTSMLLDDVHEVRRSIKRDITDDMIDPPNIPPGLQGDTVSPVEGVPGLLWRPFNVMRDIDLCAPVAIEAGLELPECPGTECHCDPPGAHAWISLMKRFARHDRWRFILEYKGSPIQAELVTFLDGKATINFTMHFNRERPHWFWREAEKPIFERLARAGYKTVFSRTRKDRPDWIAALKKNYGAVEVAEEEKVRVLEYPIDLNIFKGIPARLSLGSDWSLSQDNITIREATDIDYSAVVEMVRDAWKGNPRLELSLRVLDEWWNLDRAALLLMYEDGKLIDARLFRHRTGNIVSVSSLVPLSKILRQLALYAGLYHQWARQLGYKKMTTFVDEESYQRNQLVFNTKHANRGWVLKEIHRRFRKPMVEMEYDISEG